MQRLSMKIGGEKAHFSKTVTIKNVCAEVNSHTPADGVQQWELFLFNNGDEKSPVI